MVTSLGAGNGGGVHLRDRGRDLGHPMATEPREIGLPQPEALAEEMRRTAEAAATLDRRAQSMKRQWDEMWVAEWGNGQGLSLPFLARCRSFFAQVLAMDEQRDNLKQTFDTLSANFDGVAGQDELGVPISVMSTVTAARTTMLGLDTSVHVVVFGTD